MLSRKEMVKDYPEFENSLPFCTELVGIKSMVWQAYD